MKAKGQMSESMPLAIFLTLAGGLQDAYSLANTLPLQL